MEKSLNKYSLKECPRHGDQRPAFNGISEYFSPWLDDSSGENFERIISTKIQLTRDTWSDVNIRQPESFEIDDNPLGVEELREEIQTFPAKITDENFKLWGCISIL